MFEEHSVLCRKIRTSESYWKYIIEVKHPESFKNMGLNNALILVKQALKNPEIVIKERLDPSVFIYYMNYKERYFICVIAKHLNGEGYIITAYITDRIKKGEVVYEKI